MLDNLNWKKARYNKRQIQKSCILASLSHVYTRSNYNVFKVNNVDNYVIVFSDQTELLEYIQENINSIFLLRFLVKSNNKYEYDIDIDGDFYPARTVAMATTLFLEGIKLQSAVLKDKTVILKEYKD